jgi:hypothetical protein
MLKLEMQRETGLSMSALHSLIKDAELPVKDSYTEEESQKILELHAIRSQSEPEPEEEAPDPFDQERITRNGLKSQATYAALELIQEVSDEVFTEIQPHLGGIFRQCFRRKLVGVMPANFSMCSEVDLTQDPSEVLKNALLSYGIQPQLQLKSANPQ